MERKVNLTSEPEEWRRGRVLGTGRLCPSGLLWNLLFRGFSFGRKTINKSLSWKCGIVFSWKSFPIFFPLSFSFVSKFIFPALESVPSPLELSLETCPQFWEIFKTHQICMRRKLRWQKQLFSKLRDVESTNWLWLWLRVIKQG